MDILHRVSAEGDVDAIREIIRLGADIEAKDTNGDSPLHHASAAAEGHPDAIRELVSLGADIEAKNTHGDSPLHLASSNGHRDAIRELVHLGADIEAKNTKGNTPLYHASSNGHHDAIRELVRLGAHIQSTNSSGRTPLHTASLSGHPDAIIGLVSLGAEIEAKDTNGNTPLHAAASNASQTGDPDAMMELVMLGADIEAKDSEGLTPLHFASSNPEAIMKLVSCGADVGAKDYNGKTPLHDASSNPDAIMELVSRGADVGAKDSNGRTPLHYASARGNPDAIMELVSLGADIEAKTTEGETPLHVAEGLDEGLDATRKLVSLRANVDTKDTRGNTCLIYAAMWGKPDVVRTLIQAGAHLNSVDSQGVTALTHATRGVSRNRPDQLNMKIWNVARILAENNANGDEGYQRYPSLLQLRMGGNKRDYDKRSKDLHRELHNPGEVARLILDGADVDAILGGYTPLMRACLRNMEETVVILVNAGASMEKRGVDGYTPIIISSSLGNTETVRFLIEAGADILSKSDPPKNRFTRRLNVGYNSLMVACFSGHISTVQTLIDGGIDMDDVDSDGNTALHIAAIQKKIEIVELLIGKGARVNTVNANGTSPLMMATVAGEVNIVDILTRGGATIDIGSLTMGQRLRTMVRRGPMLDTTFTQGDLMNHTISTVSGYLGNCENVNDLRLQDGRCVQMNTREARRVMMNLVNAPVDPSRFVLPLQRAGTCWFYAAIAALFVSDRTRQCTQDLRRAMILGRKNVDGVKFSPPLAKVLVKFNVVIQAILCGNTHDGSVHSTLPIINNDEVVLGLHENGVTISGLNCGYNIYDFIKNITTTLFDNTKVFSIPGFLDTRASKMRSSVHVTIFKKGMKLRRTVHGVVYETDSVIIHSDGHSISGLTLDGERCIYDSNVGVIKIDWEECWKEPGKTFRVSGRSYSFQTSKVYVFRCPLNQR